MGAHALVFAYTFEGCAIMLVGYLGVSGYEGVGMNILETVGRCVGVCVWGRGGACCV